MTNIEPTSGRAGYLEAYSLSCEPFAEAIDARFFYGGTALMQHLDLLGHLTQFGESVVLVSGPRGSGKTTLLTRFVAQTGGQWRLCLINADEFKNFTSCLAEAVRSGEVTSDQELVTQWASRTDSSQLLVIVIDNAEQLDEPDFDRLSSLLKHPQAERLRLILFGTPETQYCLKQTIERNALSCTTQFLEVPRLSEEDTASYLMYRLAVAGYSGESPFTATEVRAICKAADGRPGTINKLAHEALLEHHARAKGKRIGRSTGKRKVNSLTWGIASIAIVAVTTYLGLHRYYQDSADIPDHLAITPELEVPLAIPQPKPLSPEPEITPPFRIAKQSQPAEPVPDIDTTSETPEPESSLRAAEPVLTEPVPAAPAAQLIVAAKDDKKVSVTPAAMEESTLTTGRAADTVAEPASQPAQAQAVKPSRRDKIPQQPASAAKPTALAVGVESTQATATLPHREEWLLEQPEASFSLQLLGSRSEKSVTDFIQRHRLDKSQAAYYKGNYKGSAWYVLMYGVYPSKQAALAARDRLPAKVRKNKPWPRSLLSVQTAIREIQ